MNESWYTNFKKTRWHRRAIWAGVALVVYSLVGFLLLPIIIRSQLLQRLPALTHRQVAIEAIRINPYSLSFTMRGFALTETNGDTFASVGELYVNFQLSSVFRGAWTFSEVSVKKPFGQVTRLKDGTFNFANLIPPATNAPKPPPAPLPAVIVQLLSIEDGAVAWTDQTQPEPFQTRLSPIRLELTQLTTQRDKNSPYAFVASDDSGMKLSWSGRVAVTPPSSFGTLKVEGISLPKYSAYGAPFFLGHIQSGRAAVEGKYTFELGEKGMAGGLTNGVFQLRDLKVSGTNAAETLVSLPVLDVKGISAGLTPLSARVEDVFTSGLMLAAQREPDGSINLLNLLKPQPPATNAPTATNAALPFQLAVDRVTVTNYTLQVADLTLPKPGKVKVDQLAVSVTGFTTATNAPVALHTQLRLNEAGTVEVGGTVHAFPPDAEINVSVAGLDIRPFQPFGEPFVNIALRGGLVGVTGRAIVALPTGGAPQASFTGDVSLDGLDTADGAALQDFVKWQSLQVKGIDFKLTPMDVQVEEVSLKGLNTSLFVGADQSINLLTVLRQKQGGDTNAAPAVVAETPAVPVPAPASTPAPAAKPLPVRLKLLTLEGASLHFGDRSVQPNCNFAVQQFDVKVNGLSTLGETPAELSVSGRIDELSPFSISGRLRPVLESLLVDLVISNKNTDLTAFTPYMEKFGGYPIVKGKLSVGLKYEVEGKALKAEHSVLVDQFTLGSKNNSPDAIKLPLKLGVALLKDRHGKIELDLPVTGRLDDPKFRVFPVVMQVLVNLVAKAVTSPFALLGKLVGGGEELSYAAFEPGTAVLNVAEQGKMEKLAKALYERPGLNLEIAGSADPAADRAALAKAHFEEQLKTAKLKEIAATGATPPAATDLVLEPTDRARLIMAAYVAAFGPLDTGTVTNAVTNAPAVTLPVITNLATAAVVAPTPPAKPRSYTFERRSGAQIMQDLQSAAKKAATTNAVVTTPTSPAPEKDERGLTSAATTTTTPPAAPTITLEEMIARLLAKIEVPDAELTLLMQQRAQSVEAFMQKTGNVAAERLFIIAPKPVGPDFKGETRVNLLLN